MSNALYQGDCRVVLQAFDSNNRRLIPSNSIDLIATDPPYFIDGMGDDWSHKRLNARKAKAGIIKGLPIGMKFDKRQSRRLYEFFEPVASHCYDVLKPGGFFCVFAQGRLYHAVAMAADDAGFEIKDMMAWRYDRQPKGFTLKHFVERKNIPDKEKLQILEKIGDRRTPQLRPQFDPILLAQKPVETTFVDNYVTWDVGLIDPKSGENGSYPGTVQEISYAEQDANVIDTIQEIKPEPNRHIDHMTVKPVRLMERLISTFASSEEEQKILDPFIGSGTTAIAAHNLGQKFIGIDTEPEYLKIAQNRLWAMGCSAEIIEVLGDNAVLDDHADLFYR